MEVQQLATNVPERFVPESMRDELLAAEHLARYEWAGGLAPGRRVLDAGCGTGYGAEMLAAAGAASVMGVDSAAAVVEAARARAGGRLAFERADVARLPYDDGSFDLVTCFEVIEHVPDPGAVLGELRRVLAPGGVLAISSPNADRYPPGNPHHVREFTTSEFRALLAEAFPAVRLLAQHQWISSAALEERDLQPGALSVRTVKAGTRAGSARRLTRSRSRGQARCRSCPLRRRSPGPSRRAAGSSTSRASSGCWPIRPTIPRRPRAAGPRAARGGPAARER